MLLENYEILLRKITKNTTFKIPLFMFTLTTFTLIFKKKKNKWKIATNTILPFFMFTLTTFTLTFNEG